jgi:hypothetical protein
VAWSIDVSWAVLRLVGTGVGERAPSAAEAGQTARSLSVTTPRYKLHTLQHSKAQHAQYSTAQHSTAKRILALVAFFV